jgi:alcohol dehydrogenase class IV
VEERRVRFGVGALAELGDVAGELGLRRLLLVTTRRAAAAHGAGLPVAAVYDGVRSHVPVETVREAAGIAGEIDADGLVGLGGGSAVDTCKAITVELLEQRELRTIAIPTTYAGAEWTPFFGLTLAPGQKSGGSHERARPVAAIYDPELQLDLPVGETVGTSLNALAHCAEAYYASGRSDRGDRDADRGAAAIGAALPRVVESPSDLDERTRLLEGAMYAAFALDEAGLALAHAMAQALGGRYGLSHGAMNALCLPAALRFNAEAVPEAIARFGRALGTEDPAGRVEELARLGGFERLRDFGIPAEELDEVAAAAAARPGNQANPRPASAAEIGVLLRTIW